MQIYAQLFGFTKFFLNYFLRRMPEPNSNNADERITIRRGGQAATMLSRSSNAGIKSLRLSVGGHQFFS
ncbi:MAG TPA: hypothetical protein VKT28_16945, partial [Puia sp.]|nr:hypothetical protein [Puia sp.]